MRRGSRVLTALAAVVSLVGLVGLAGPARPAAAAGPSCTFNGPAIGALVIGVSPGQVITIDCHGFPAAHPYLLVEASLLVAIDPAAKPLLTGQVTSVPGLLAVIAATPELNPLSIALPSSDGSGDLVYGYTVPSTQPPDPNATCPPTTEELNSGLIGCAVAMIDLTTFQPVVAGTFVMNFKGQPFFPPQPTLVLSPVTASRGQSVSVADRPGATTYWWLATLSSLYAQLGGGGGGGPVPVVVKEGGSRTVSNAAVTPATYDGHTFTPPKLSGSFVAKGRGRRMVHVSLTATLMGIAVSDTASTLLRVTG